MKKWRCDICDYVYDPEKGCMDEVPANTPFEELPDDWKCPMCNVPKDAFEIIG